MPVLYGSKLHILPTPTEVVAVETVVAGLVSATVYSVIILLTDLGFTTNHLRKFVLESQPAHFYGMTLASHVMFLLTRLALQNFRPHVLFAGQLCRTLQRNTDSFVSNVFKCAWVPFGTPPRKDNNLKKRSWTQTFWNEIKTPPIFLKYKTTNKQTKQQTLFDWAMQNMRRISRKAHFSSNKEIAH